MPARIDRPRVGRRLSPDEIERIRPLLVAGMPHNQIGHAIGIDRRTVSAWAKKLGMGPVKARPAALAAAPDRPDQPQPQVPAAPEPLSRVSVARARLWTVLTDPNSPGRDVVGAFNALAESEGWSRSDALELPEPKSDDERLERLVALVTSMPDGVRTALLERLAS